MPHKDMPDKVIQFQLKNETKGALRYEEIDANGVVLAQDDWVIGSLYLRKSKIRGTPKNLTIAIVLE